MSADVLAESAIGALLLVRLDVIEFPLERVVVSLQADDKSMAKRIK